MFKLSVAFGIGEIETDSNLLKKALNEIYHSI